MSGPVVWRAEPHEADDVGLLLVYLTLAAQYESFLLPFIILLGVPLAVLGGDSLRDFAIALLIGLVVGTYSSVFTATPLLTYLHQKAPMSRVKKEKVVREPDDSGAVI